LIGLPVGLAAVVDAPDDDVVDDPDEAAEVDDPELPPLPDDELLSLPQAATPRASAAINAAAPPRVRTDMLSLLLHSCPAPRRSGAILAAVTS